MTCNNSCLFKYNAIHQDRGTLTRRLYAEGQRFCSVCSVKYLKLDGLVCPCCNTHIKSGVRNRNRRRYEPSLLVRIR